MVSGINNVYKVTKPIGGSFFFMSESCQALEKHSGTIDRGTEIGVQGGGLWW